VLLCKWWLTSDHRTANTSQVNLVCMSPVCSPHFSVCPSLPAICSCGPGPSCGRGAIGLDTIHGLTPGLPRRGASFQAGVHPPTVRGGRSAWPANLYGVGLRSGADWQAAFSALTRVMFGRLRRALEVGEGPYSEALGEGSPEPKRSLWPERPPVGHLSCVAIVGCFLMEAQCPAPTVWLRQR
jgi:hypothetical protein